MVFTFSQFSLSDFGGMSVFSLNLLAEGFLRGLWRYN